MAGPGSIVDGSRLTSLSAVATLAAFTSQFIHANQNGLVGIGTIKNTGANSLEVREDVTDAFGTVVSSTPVTVLSGNDYMLDPQTNFATGRPPYVSYDVLVRHPGAATTFDLRYTARGQES